MTLLSSHLTEAEEAVVTAENYLALVASDITVRLK